MFRFATFFTFNKNLLQIVTLISFPYYYNLIIVHIENIVFIIQQNIVPIQLVDRKSDKDHLMIFLFLLSDSSIKVK